MVAGAAVIVIVAGACEPEALTSVRFDQTREAAQVDPLSRSSLLFDASRANSQRMCDAGAVTPSADPADDYRPITNLGADEWVGASPLDPSIDDPVERRRAAGTAIWSTWSDDPSVVDARWDDLGVGQHECADGNLYLTAVATQRPTMPASGPYAGRVHQLDEITAVNNLTYTTAINYQGNPVNLQLDLHLPPSTGEPRPLVIAIHGGGFTGGNRGQMTGTAQEFARRGYVGATISYRLDPSMGSNPTEAQMLVAALNGIDDGMESVRWLRANAASYEIDVDRIAMVGSSAGGVVAMGTAVIEDLTPGGPLAAHSPRINAAVSTGVNLTPGIGLIQFDKTDGPVLMYHYDVDTVTGDSVEYAMQTCTAIRDAGSTCDFVRQVGSGHTIGLSPSGASWATIGPFLWAHLDLHA